MLGSGRGPGDSAGRTLVNCGALRLSGPAGTGPVGPGGGGGVSPALPAQSPSRLPRPIWSPTGAEGPWLCPLLSTRLGPPGRGAGPGASGARNALWAAPDCPLRSGPAWNWAWALQNSPGTRQREVPPTPLLIITLIKKIRNPAHQI